MSHQAEEVYISVDVETSGPVPGEYSLLSIGACLVFEPECAFYTELQPLSNRADPLAMEVSNLSLSQLAEHGLAPEDAMERFERWVLHQASSGQKPVFVGFNAAFDWMFISYYLHRFLGRNPFGHSALDIKSYYMGLKGTRWAETSMRYLANRYLDNEPLAHHALGDAQRQALLFSRLWAESKARHGSRSRSNEGPTCCE